MFGFLFKKRKRFLGYLNRCSILFRNRLTAMQFFQAVELFLLDNNA